MPITTIVIAITRASSSIKVNAPERMYPWSSFIRSVPCALRMTERLNVYALNRARTEITPGIATK